MGNKLKIILDAESRIKGVLTKALGGIKSFAKSAGQLVKRVAVGMTALGASVVGLGVYFVRAASDVEEMNGKFGAVFKDLAGEAEEWAKKTGAATNKSANELKGYLASLQDTFVPLGFARDKSAEFSKSLTQLAIDLGSFNNVATGDVVRDLQSAIVGNTETVRKYGIVLLDAQVKQKAVEMGLAASTKEVGQAAKAQARLQLIMEGSTDAQGDAVRTAGSLANRWRGLVAALQDMRVEVGQSIMEGLDLAAVFGSWTEKIREFQDSEAFANIQARLKSMLQMAKAMVNAFIEGGKARSQAWEALKDVLIGALKTGATAAGDKLMEVAPKIGAAIGEAAKAVVTGGERKAAISELQSRGDIGALESMGLRIPGMKGLVGKFGSTRGRRAESMIEEEIAAQRERGGGALQVDDRLTRGLASLRQLAAAEEREGEQIIANLEQAQKKVDAETVAAKGEEEAAAKEPVAQVERALALENVAAVRDAEIDAVEEVADVRRQAFGGVGGAGGMGVDVGAFAGSQITPEQVGSIAQRSRVESATRLQAERVEAIVGAFVKGTTPGNDKRDVILQSIADYSKVTAETIEKAVGMS